MTPQEQQMLQGLADRVNQTSLSEKDPQAEQFLGGTLGRNPDALYILSQTVLVQQYALDNAKKQLDEAKQQLEQARQQAAQPQKHTSFLGSLLGSSDEPARPAPPPPPQQQPQYAPVANYGPPQPPYGQPSYAQPAYTQPSFAQGGFGAPAMAPQPGGFLRSAMQTATGVAAGALAFEGIESLMHGFGGHSSGFGGGQGFDGGMGGQGRPEEIINNNYYGSDSGSSLGERAEHEGRSADVEDRRDDSGGRAGFADSSVTDDDSSSDNSGTDDPQSNFADDSGSFDDGSSSGSDDSSFS